MASKKFPVLFLAAWAAACSPPSQGKGPTDVVASGISDRDVTLTWKDSANGETRFSVERSELSEASGYNEVGTVAAGGTSFHDQSVQPMKNYYYKVSALYDDGSRISSAPLKVTTMIAAVIPASPTELTATPATMNSVNLTWVDNSPNETGFEVERGAAQTGPFTHVTTTAADAVAYTDSGLTKSTTYWYRVHSTNTAGNSGNSLAVSATTPITNDKVAPSVPMGVTATSVSSSSITVTWLASTDDDSGVASYSVQINGTEAALITAPTLTFTATLLGSGREYCYQVIAVDAVGNRSAPSSPDACATTGGTQVIPNPPSNPDAGPIAQTSITVTWKDNSGDESGFKVERATAAGGPFTTLNKPDAGTPTTAANAVSYQVTGLTAATVYFFRVSAVNGAGASTTVQCTAKTLP